MPTHPPIDPELKTRVIQACLVPGAKMATVARAYGVKEHRVRDWVRAHKLKQTNSPVVPACVPLQLIEDHATEVIKIECQRGVSQYAIHWPANQAEACARWLGELLR